MVSQAKRLRARALERIDISPGLTAAYRRPVAMRWIVAAIGFAVLGPFAAYMAAVMLWVLVVVGGFFSLGPLVTRNWGDGPVKDVPLFPGSALATHAWLAAAILAIAIGMGRDELFFPKASLRSLAYTPYDDRQAFRFGRLNFWIAIGLVTLWQASVFGWVARYEQATLLQWAMIGPLAAVQAAVIHSCVLIAITHLRSEPRIEEALGHALPLLGFGYFLLWTSQGFPAWTPAIARQALTLVGWLLPTGWIDALYWHGVLGGQVWAWLFLLPCAAIIAAGIICRRWPLLLREIRISPQGQFTPIFADDPEPAEAKTIPPARPVPTSHPATAPRPLVLKRLLERPLGGGDWSDGWFVERWIGSRLSRRERGIVEYLVGERPNWTVSYYIGLSLLVLLTGLAVLFSLAARDHEDRAAIFILVKAASCGAMLFGCVHFPRHWQLTRHSQRQPTVSTLPIVPLGFADLLVTSLKVAAWRLALWLPVLATVLVLAGLRLGQPVELLVNGLATVAGAVLALAALDPLFRFSNRTRYEFSLHRCAFLLLLALLLIAAPLLLAIPFWRMAIAIGVALPVFALGGAMYYDWLHRTGRIDYRV